MAVHVKAKYPRHDVKGIVSELRDRICVEAQIWRKVPKMFGAALKVPRRQWPPTFLYERSSEPLRLFLELATQPN